MTKMEEFIKFCKQDGNRIELTPNQYKLAELIITSIEKEPELATRMLRKRGAGTSLLFQQIELFYKTQ